MPLPGSSSSPLRPRSGGAYRPGHRRNATPCSARVQSPGRVAWHARNPRRTSPHRSSGRTAAAALPPEPSTEPSTTGRGAADLAALPSDLAERLIQLPRTRAANVGDRASDLACWLTCLGRGVLPTPATTGDADPSPLDVGWPDEPFLSEFLDTLADLEMPSLMRRHPKLAPLLAKHMLDLVEAFEIAADADDASEDASQQQPPPPSQGASLQSRAGADGDSAAPPDASASQTDADADASTEADAEAPPGLDAAKQLMEEFREAWEPVADALDASEAILEGVDDLAMELRPEEQRTLGGTKSLWQHSGWQEMKDLSAKLRRLPQLRRLVRELGRGSSGRGPRYVRTNRCSLISSLSPRLHFTNKQASNPCMHACTPSFPHD